jgi:hypothetical protein
LKRVVNWFGLAAGIATIVLLAASLFVPWWLLTIGDGLVTANASPLNTNFSLKGESVPVPLLWALNLGSMLTLASGGIIMLIYSVIPAKPYGIKLLNFSYRKPIYSVVFFVVSLLSILIVVRNGLGLDVPIIGASKLLLPQQMTMGATVKVLVSTSFQWPFWLGIITAALCVVAKVFHFRFVPKPLTIVDVLPDMCPECRKLVEKTIPEIRKPKEKKKKDQKINGEASIG